MNGEKLVKKLENPLFQYHLVGYHADPTATVIVLELMGEDGEEIQVTLDSPEITGGTAELLWEAAVELFEAQEYGIERVVAIKGQQMANPEKADLTVEHILDNDTGAIGGVMMQRDDIIYPWNERVRKKLEGESDDS